MMHLVRDAASSGKSGEVNDVMAHKGSSNVDREAGGIIEFGIPGLLSVSNYWPPLWL